MKSVILIIVLVFSTLLFPQQKENDWLTYFEKSDFKGTPSYDLTVKYFSKFLFFPEVKIFSIGKSPQGRNITALIVSREKKFTPQEVKKSGKPVVFITAGIHGGEIEGKDALMLLMREIFVDKTAASLLNNLTLIFVPVFNVDGHERISPYNRINQNGPVEMGWRTTAQNLNLNRDWLKADTPEMQSLLKFFNEWLPDYYIDSHTTDGADYQYTVTYGLEKYRNIDQDLAEWNKFVLQPYLIKSTEEKGYLISPYVGFKNDMPDSGLYENPSPPRFSTGYAAAQNRPSLLIETHMMKPYKDRVFSTKAVITGILEYINQHPQELKQLVDQADKNSVRKLFTEKKSLPVAFELSDVHKKFLYKGIEAVKDTSKISASMKTVYTGRKYEKYIPHYDTSVVIDSIYAPSAYIIPQEWSILAERLHLHGVKTEIIEKDTLLDVKRYKFKNVKFAQSSYEGRTSVNFDFDTYSEKNHLVRKGSFLVTTNQRTIRVIMHLLDPKSPDSFVRWGFMNSIFEQKEYFEDYVMEKVSLEMLKENPELQKEFDDWLSQEENSTKNYYQRLGFFYERSPYYDKNLRVYPVLFIE